MSEVDDGSSRGLEVHRVDEDVTYQQNAPAVGVRVVIAVD